MLYIIKEMYVFSPETRELRLNSDHEITLTLSNQASRLLMEFIKNGDEVLSKDFLLKVVWQDFGLTPSSHNVYSAMSELRRSFSSIGEVETVIKTVPKIGFQFTQQVRQFSEKVESNEVPENEGGSKATNALTLLIVIFFSIMTLLSSYVVAESQRKKIKTRDKEAESIGTINNCSIYSLGHDFSSKDKIKANVKDNVRINKICSMAKYDVFYAELYNKENYTFIATCDISESDNRTHKNCVVERKLK